MADMPVSEIIRDWTAKKFPTLDSIPKDAEERNKIFREFATSNKELDPKKHLGVFYTQLEKHVKSLSGNFSDYVKKRQIVPKPSNVGSSLQTKVTLEPKSDPSKVNSQKSSASNPSPSVATLPQATETQATTGPQTTLTPTPEQVAQGKKLCAWIAKLPVTVARLSVSEIPELSKDEEEASGEALYPIFAPYIGDGTLMKWIIGGSIMLNIYGGRYKIYREKIAAKKADKPQQQPKEPEQKTGFLEPQNTKSEKSEDIPKREREAMIKRLKEKGYSEEKIRELID